MWFYYLFIYEEQYIGLIEKQYAPAFCSLFILPGSISREELSISRLRCWAAVSQKSSNTKWTASVMLYVTDSTNLILLFTITLPFRKFSISNCLNPVRLDCRYGTSWKMKENYAINVTYIHYLFWEIQIYSVLLMLLADFTSNTKSNFWISLSVAALRIDLLK